MSPEETPSPDIDLQAALRDPQLVFRSPEEVRDHASLSREDKIRVLRRWEYDVRDEEVAEEEGMPPTSAEDPLNRIYKALADLDAPSDDEGPPLTKQGGQ